MVISTASCMELYYRGSGDPVHVKARVISLDSPSAVSGSHMKIEIRGPMFCTKILRNTMFRARIPLEGIGGTYRSIDSPAEHLSDENVSRLLIIEFFKPASARKVGLILYRPELEKEEYVRIGVWRQHLEIIDPMKWKEEHPILNMKEKTIFLIWNKQDNVRHKHTNTFNAATSSITLYSIIPPSYKRPIRLDGIAHIHPKLSSILRAIHPSLDVCKTPPKP